MQIKRKIKSRITPATPKNPNSSPIIEKIKSSDIYNNQLSFDNNFEVEKQREICKLVLKKMNIPKDSTRLDISTHPFTTSIGNFDVRITTNFEHENPLFSFFSTVHEGGHALYELGLPIEEFKDTVISGAPSLGLHESQSRFWENIIARSRYFWNYFYPIFTKMYPNLNKKSDLEKWYYYINQVRPSLIRVEADELTYCLHIVLRFEIELELIDGEIKVSELPIIPISISWCQLNFLSRTKLKRVPKHINHIQPESLNGAMSFLIIAFSP